MADPPARPPPALVEPRLRLETKLIALLHALDHMIEGMPEGWTRTDAERARERVAEIIDLERVSRGRRVARDREARLRLSDAGARLQRFETLFASAPVAILVSDRLGVVRVANRRAGALFGSDIGAEGGTALSTLVETKHLRAFRSALEALVQGDDVRAMEVRFRPRDLPPFDAWVDASPTGLENPRWGVLWALVEPPQSTRESSGWKEREATMRRFVDGMPAIAWATDIHLRITLLRGGVLATLGLRPDELAGTDLSAFLDVTGPAPELIDAHLRALEGEESAHVHIIKDRWYQTRVEPIHDARGNVTGCTAISVDVTSQKDLEAALGRALARERGAVALLRSIDRAKDALLSSIAHDMRTPLATITLSAQMLTERRSDLSDDQADHLLGLVRHSGERLSRYVADAFDPAKMSEDMIAAARTSLDIGRLVRMVAEETPVPERPVDIEAAAVVVEADPVAVERIVANLLANVVSHTPPGTRVWVRAQPYPEGAVITVEDDGPGVPDDAKEAVFAPHVRGTDSEGTGVGLGLVARYSAMHGGRAWVEDRPGGGASFKVFFPSHAPPVVRPRP